MKWWWILAAGVGIAIAAFAYAWYRGGEESEALALLALCV